ncbi:hypothetical protein GCM10022257_24010 [Hyunsoonleella aestuarii]|uniref:Uncharacterized protein n=1 Tax=Hyunsoonleella aestuarii TaxID=912802 RepID=A0ABP8EE28_9FLAO
MYVRVPSQVIGSGSSVITGPVGVRTFPQLSLTDGGVIPFPFAFTSHSTVDAPFASNTSNPSYSIVTVCT